MIPLVEREFYHWMLPLVDRNLHLVGILPLVERECNHWMITLVDRNVNQGVPIVESGD